MYIIEEDVRYISDEELARIGYEKDGLVWIIEGKRYRVKCAAAHGIFFVETKM